MDENKQNKSFLQSVPDIVKGWLGLIIAIAGVIIAIRTDQQLYTVLFVGVILIVWLSIAIYVVFAHIPGTFSKKGIYRYEAYRWAAFISIGFITSLVISFSIFTPNRSYVSQSFMGTPTPTTSPTIIPFTPTEAPTPIPTPTETPTSTPTPTILFQENFLNNNNGWNLPVASTSSSYSANGKIIGGKLEYFFSCANTSGYACENWLQIPRITAKNFDLIFETKITQNYNNAPLNIGVKFRSVSGTYYTVYFSNKGDISVFLVGNGLNDFIVKDVFSSNINQGINETNQFEIIAQDSTFIFYANGQEVTRIEDGNNSSIGNIFLGLQLSQTSNFARVEIDNIKIQEVR
jgi:hypothetical protein